MSGSSKKWGRPDDDKLPVLDGGPPEAPEYDMEPGESTEYDRNPKMLDRQPEMNPEAGRKAVTNDTPEEDTPMFHSDSLPDTPDEFSFFKPKKQ